MGTELKITSEEFTRIKKAFGDPEFRKLFKEYADEISDPTNRRKYEQEIRAMEFEQGMDVEFINPVPDHCLKTRHWPDILKLKGDEETLPGCNDSKWKNTKVFINVCKSDKVGLPELKPNENNLNMYWRLPHCFSPPHDDFDKQRVRVVVYDVSFHPKSFEAANKSPALSLLIDSTAIEGVQTNFNLRFGKTFIQAFEMWKLNRSSRSAGNMNDGSASDVNCERVFRLTHRLKGVLYKGVAHPTVIRRRRSDYDQCQIDLKKRETEELNLCENTMQREALRKLSDFSKLNGGKEVSDVSTCSQNNDQIRTPKYSITFSSDFDIGNHCHTPVKNHLPDRLKVDVELPGLLSSASIDLDVTRTDMLLKSEKPVAYELKLKLPYEVEDAKGSAKFDKSTSTLFITVPLVTNSQSLTGNRSIKPTAKLDSKINKLEDLTLNSESINLYEDHIENGQQQSSQGVSKGIRRRRRRRRNSSQSKDVVITDNHNDTSSISSSLSVVNSSSNGCTSFSEVHIEQAQPEPVSVNNCSPTCTVDEQSKRMTAGSVELQHLITEIDHNELIVTKHRRLAPIRFRQDPFSLTLLLGVRGILPNSLTINWCKCPRSILLLNQTDGSTNQPLILLITFSSRGSGGCTMDWGVVVCCPPLVSSSFAMETASAAERNGTPVKDTSSSESSIVMPDGWEAPQILTSHISSTNAVVNIRKPSSLKSCEFSTHLINNNKSSDYIRQHAIWWPSIATGRTLNAGMQNCPFVGMEYFSFSSKCKTYQLQTDLSVHMSTTESNVAHLDSQNEPLKTEPNLRVVTLSTDVCCIELFHDQSQMDCCSGRPDLVVTQDSSDNVKLKNQQNPVRCGPLKGILKQRSISESSGDELVTYEGHTLRVAGLADTGQSGISSDEFPTVSSDDEAEDENRYQFIRRSHSMEKFCTVDSEKASSSTTGIGHGGGRQRLRSVNFSRRDQKVDYSPSDTVETLHHTLSVRRKKALKIDENRRRRKTEKLRDKKKKSSDCTTHCTENSNDQKQHKDRNISDVRSKSDASTSVGHDQCGIESQHKNEVNLTNQSPKAFGTRSLPTNISTPVTVFDKLMESQSVAESITPTRHVNSAVVLNALSVFDLDEE